VRGLCTDVLVLCTCWYVPTDSGWGGVQYIEDRVMNRVSYILRLLFSFFVFPDTTLQEIIAKSLQTEVPTRLPRKKQSTTQSKQGSKDPTVPSSATSKTNPRNKKGNGGLNDDFGGDEFEDEIDSEEEEEEEERLRAWSAFLNWDRICRGELPFTKENIDLCASLADPKNQRVSDSQSECDHSHVSPSRTTLDVSY
jgi:hypothetical protein